MVEYVSIEGFTGSYVLIQVYLQCPMTASAGKRIFTGPLLFARGVRRAQLTDTTDHRHHKTIIFCFKYRGRIVLVVVLVHWLMV